MKNRYLVEFNSEYGLQPWIVDTISKPKLNVTPNIAYENRIGDCPNKFVWNDIELTFIACALGDTTRENLIEFFKTYNHSLGHTFSFKLITIDPAGIEISKWIIEVQYTEIISLNDNGEGFVARFQPFRCICIF